MQTRVANELETLRLPLNESSQFQPANLAYATHRRRGRQRSGIVDVGKRDIFGFNRLEVNPLKFSLQMETPKMQRGT